MAKKPEEDYDSLQSRVREILQKGPLPLFRLAIELKYNQSAIGYVTGRMKDVYEDDKGKLYLMGEEK